MVGVSMASLIDLTRTTLQDLPDNEFETALPYQKSHALNYWFGKNKKMIHSGTEILRSILLDDSGNAKFVRPYQKTPINVANVQQQLTAPWVRVQTDWSIALEEFLANRKPARFIDLVKSKRTDALLSLAKLMERRAWLTPQSSTDDLNPRGLAYWISKLPPSGRANYDSTIDVDQDFSGRFIIWGDGTFTHTSKAGISPTTYSKWRNYCATYTAINSDFLTRMGRAFHETEFESPMTLEDLREGYASNYRIYMAVDELVAFEALANAQNDNNGPDLDKFFGMTVFKRVPVLNAPVLKEDTSNPVYGVNHACFKPFVREGLWMKESEPMVDKEQHLVETTFNDSQFQYMATNVRECGFVLHNALST